jgi:hypothetical protein
MEMVGDQLDSFRVEDLEILDRNETLRIMFLITITSFLLEEIVFEWEIKSLFKF